MEVFVWFLRLRVKIRAPSITSRATAIGPTTPVDSATADADEEEVEVVELEEIDVVSLVVVLLVVEEEGVVEVLVVEVVEVVLPPTTVSPVAFTAEGACVEHSLTWTVALPVTPLTEV